MTAPVQVGPSPTSGGPMPTLAPIQMRILQLLAEGNDQEQIAYIARVSEKTVRNHLQKMKQVFGAFNNTHLVHLAYQSHVLEAPPRHRHGDHAGYAAHLYRGEKPCEACRAGERKYRAELSAARKRARAHAA
ncbi:helix-turn-helix transcriptional regulator (plasmid) [Streptomyces platensis]|uniref:helix-turn-helix domain-containing protein n=1 Tax=Streptomyces platensis TaxID=58346 RepID=UPI002ED26AA6|nr:helix-turn-helix transcriptional regulator [Streptomyces platensis]